MLPTRGGPQRVAQDGVHTRRLVTTSEDKRRFAFEKAGEMWMSDVTRNIDQPP